MSLKQKTVSGIGWNAVARLGHQLLSFTITIILARLLMPRDFGMIGMILVFIRFGDLFRDIGFGKAIIQRKEIDESHLSSVFWLNIVLGLILTLIAYLAAPLIARFYNMPQLRLIVMFISLKFLLESFSLVQESLIDRSMNFRRLARVKITTTFITGCITIAMAFLGYGVWSLAWEVIITPIVFGVIIYALSEWKPRLIFDLKAFKELMHFSSHLFGARFFDFWFTNSAILLVGRFFGSSDLGIYSRADSITQMPSGNIGYTLERVVFASLSKIQDNKARVRDIYLRATRAVSLITFPMLVGLFVVADYFVLAALGPQWIEVIPLMRVLAIAGMVDCINIVPCIYESQGKTDWMLRWRMVSGTLVFLSICAGIAVGTLMAVVVSYVTMKWVILIYHNFTIPGKLIDMSFMDVVNSVKGVLGCTLLMGASVWLIDIYIFPQDWPNWVHLITETASGIILYLAIVHIFNLEAYRDIRELLASQFQQDHNVQAS